MIIVNNPAVSSDYVYQHTCPFTYLDLDLIKSSQLQLSNQHSFKLFCFTIYITSTKMQLHTTESIRVNNINKMNTGKKTSSLCRKTKASPSPWISSSLIYKYTFLASAIALLMQSHLSVDAFSLSNSPRNALRIQPHDVDSNNYPKSDRREGTSVTTCRSRIPLGPFQTQKKAKCIVGHTHSHSLMVMTSPDDSQDSPSIDNDNESETNTKANTNKESESDEEEYILVHAKISPDGQTVASPSQSLPSPSPSAAELKLPAATTDSYEKKKRTKYQRKRPRRGSEEEHYKLRKKRQAKYEDLKKDGDNLNLLDFESLFPAPVWDDEIILRDLYGASDRDAKAKAKAAAAAKAKAKAKAASYGNENGNGKKSNSTIVSPKVDAPLTRELTKLQAPKIKSTQGRGQGQGQGRQNDILVSAIAAASINTTAVNTNSTKIDRSLTRMVEDRLYGFRRDQMGEFEYDTSLMGEGAVQFREGVRLGNALKVNCDRLNHFAKKEFAKGKLEEAEELYETAIKVAPRDGRAYLGLSRIAQKRRDFKYAKDCLKTGIANSFGDGTFGANGVKSIDTGANPFLLQALGTLEERMGHLAEAEKLFIAAARSRPSHAAAWVALAQLRTRKLRQGPNAGRICYQTAETELRKAGLSPSSHVYTAWASLEWKAGEIRRARELFRMALEIDPKCSAAWNQLGVMETQEENWKEAEKCFETVLKYDRRNSRVLQAYAIMETKRPDTDSRMAIGLFEKALKANPRDGGVLQAYALYVAKFGDIDSARDL